VDDFSRDTTDPARAERAARISLLSPDSRVDGAALAALIKTGHGADSPWKELLNALAEYPLGHWDAAADWARKARATPGTRDGSARGTAAAVLAMAKHQQQHPEVAAKPLAGEQKAITAKWPQGNDKDWHDWLIADLLAKEAEALLK